MEILLTTLIILAVTNGAILRMILNRLNNPIAPRVPVIDYKNYQTPENIIEEILDICNDMGSPERYEVLKNDFIILKRESIKATT